MWGGGGGGGGGGHISDFHQIINPQTATGYDDDPRSKRDAERARYERDPETKQDAERVRY